MVIRIEAEDMNGLIDLEDLNLNKPEGYLIAEYGFASGKELIQLFGGSPETRIPAGSVSYILGKNEDQTNAPSGYYEIQITYYDESDDIRELPSETRGGELSIELNDKPVGQVIVLDQNPDGANVPTPANRITATIADRILLQPGDTLTINGRASFPTSPEDNPTGPENSPNYDPTYGEYTRIDYIELIPIPILPPIANPDVGSIKEDAVPNFIEGNILANDTDPDGPEPLIVSSLTYNNQPLAIGEPVELAYGTITLNSDGSYEYTLDNDNPIVNQLQEGEPLPEAPITYVVTDGAETAESTLTIEIEGTNDAPTATPDFGSIKENTVDSPFFGNFILGNVLANDTDPDGPEELTISSLTYNGQPIPIGEFVQLAYGTVFVNTNGFYIYLLDDSNPIVDALQEGEPLPEAPITYVVTDGVAIAESTLTIEIDGTNDAPLANPDFGTIREDVEPNPIKGNVLDNDTDPDRFQLTETGQLVVPYAVSFAGQPISIDQPIDGSYGSFVLRPNGSYEYFLDNTNPIVNSLQEGDTIQELLPYAVTDGLETDESGILTINIQGTNDAPIAINDIGRIKENRLPNPITGNVLGNDTDVDNLPSDLRVSRVLLGDGRVLLPGQTTNLSYGFFTLNSDGSYSYRLDNNNSFVDALPEGAILPELPVSYEMTDGKAVDAASLTIQIEGANDAPIAINDISRIKENRLPNPIMGNVLGNDTDVDNLPSDLRVSRVLLGDGRVILPGQTTNLSYGFFTLNSDGSYNYRLDNNNSFVDELPEGAILPELSVTYEVTDGMATSTANLAIQIEGTDAINYRESEFNNVFTIEDSQRLQALRIEGIRDGEANYIPPSFFGFEPAPNFVNGDSLRVVVQGGRLGRERGIPEVDIFSVDLNAGERIVLDVEEIEDDNPNTDMDTKLFVFAPSIIGKDNLLNPNSRPFARNSDGTGLRPSSPSIVDRADPFLDFVATETGEHYIAIATESTVWRRSAGSIGDIRWGALQFADSGLGDFGGSYNLNMSILNPNPIP